MGCISITATSSVRQYLGMIPDDIVARVDKALAISVALEKMKATDV